MQKETEIIAEGVSVLILPGLNSSGPQHWQTRWEQADPSFRRVQQKDWETPQLSDWIEGISREVARTQPPRYCT